MHGYIINILWVKAMNWDFNTSCQAAVKNPLNMFSISSHKGNFEWSATKVTENISCMPSIGKEKKKRNIGSKV